VPGISRDGFQRLRRGREEHAVNHLLVLKGDGGQLFWDCEHDVEVRHFQQLSLAVLDPLRARQRLALWAMTIPATVEAVPLMTAFITLFEVAAEGRRTAHLDCSHDAPLPGGHRSAILFPVSGAIAAEHVRHF
jgi:hypothetical protein